MVFISYFSICKIKNTHTHLVHTFIKQMWFTFICIQWVFKYKWFRIDHLVSILSISHTIYTRKKSIASLKWRVFNTIMFKIKDSYTVKNWQRVCRECVSWCLFNDMVNSLLPYWVSMQKCHSFDNLIMSYVNKYLVMSGFSFSIKCVLELFRKQFNYHHGDIFRLKTTFCGAILLPYEYVHNLHIS